MGTADEYRLDEIDRRILHALMRDARKTTAAAIAEDVSVSGATVRNRIAELEAHGVIEGYVAAVDFERADGLLTNVFLCHVEYSSVEAAVRRAGAIPGVINIRELMGGRTNLHVTVVGRDTDELRRIGRQLEEIGISIENEFLLQDELHFPYGPYAPTDSEHRQPLTDYQSLVGDAELIELTVDEAAPITGYTLERAIDEDLLDEETLLVAIERDDTTITPRGGTKIRANDIVTVFSPHDHETVPIEAFRSSEAAETDQTPS